MYFFGGDGAEVPLVHSDVDLPCALWGGLGLPAGVDVPACQWLGEIPVAEFRVAVLFSARIPSIGIVREQHPQVLAIFLYRGSRVGRLRLGKRRR